MSRKPTGNPTGRPPKYPWGRWFDGEWHELVAGRDFTMEVAQFQKYVHKRANARGLKVRTKVKGQVLLICTSRGSESVADLMPGPVVPVKSVAENGGIDPELGDALVLPFPVREIDGVPVVREAEFAPLRVVPEPVERVQNLDWLDEADDEAEAEPDDEWRPLA